MTPVEKNLMNGKNKVFKLYRAFNLETMSRDDFAKWNTELVKAVYAHNVLKAQYKMKGLI